MILESIGFVCRFCLLSEVQSADKSLEMSKQIDVALKAAEHQHDKELTSRFSAQMQASAKDVGAVDTVRNSILSYVASESYDRAIEELRKYVDSKTEFPQFKMRVERYAAYAVDLINAVRVKRSFPGLQNLSMSKQQDLFDRAMEHFEDLKITLKKIEQIDREVKIEDIRSTVLVVKAVVYCLFAVVTLGFLIELSRGVVPTAWTVLDQILSVSTNFIFDKIGL